MLHLQEPLANGKYALASFPFHHVPSSELYRFTASTASK